MERDAKLNAYHHVVVVVLGDVGRSPRMQYHALSLLEHGYQVTLVGYCGEKLIPLLNDKERLTVQRFQPYMPSAFVRSKLKPLYYLIRVVELFRLLIATLFTQVSTPVHCILVQNPPSLPLLFVASVYSYWTTSSLIIDWHNLGFSMFDKFNDTHLVPRFVKWYEASMAQFAHGHFCVTQAMQDYLGRPPFALAKATSNSTAQPVLQVLYDRPPDFFHKTTSDERHDLMMRLKQQFDAQSNDACLLPCTFPLQELAKPDRSTFLIMSSTSWTPDEDFGILLKALLELNQLMNKSGSKVLAKLAVVITGKGPQKEMYQRRIRDELRPIFRNNITVDTLWLEASDYPLLLGCADVGISLHTSTSGLDLPIKIYDMFGCGVPVCAINFKCLDEVIKHQQNGLVFHSSSELAQQLYQLMSDSSTQTLQTMQRNISKMNRWKDEWDLCAYPHIRRLCRRSDELHMHQAHRRRILAFLSLVALLIVMISVRVYNSRVNPKPI